MCVFLHAVDIINVYDMQLGHIDTRAIYNFIEKNWKLKCGWIYIAKNLGIILRVFFKFEPLDSKGNDIKLGLKICLISFLKNQNLNFLINVMLINKIWLFLRLLVVSWKLENCHVIFLTKSFVSGQWSTYFVFWK